MSSVAPTRTSSLPASARLARLLDTTADVEDILGLAEALSPLSLTLPDGRSLLRLAFERAADPHARRGSFTLESLDSLARLDPQGSDLAWAAANTPPLLTLFARAFGSSSDAPRFAPALFFRALDLAPPDQSRSLARSLLPALLRLSPHDSWGSAPALRAAALAGVNLFTDSLSSAPQSRALLQLLSSDALELARHAGVDLLEPLEATSDDRAEPLWLRWKSIAERRGSSKLALALSSFGAEHDSATNQAKTISDYFSRISRYGGEMQFRSLKGWEALRDSKGRTPMMALVASRPANLKLFWETKKALPHCKAIDSEGRSLWHWVIAKGRHAPPGASAFLARELGAPAPDAHGRGLLISLIGMRDFEGRSLSEHDWAWPGFSPAQASASDLFACPDPQLAHQAASWIANERYLGTDGSAPASTHFYISLLERLPLEQLAQIPGPIAAALALCVPFGRLSLVEPSKLIDALLARDDAFVALTPERRAQIERLAGPNPGSTRAALLDRAFRALDARAERLSLAAVSTGASAASSSSKPSSSRL